MKVIVMLIGMLIIIILAPTISSAQYLSYKYTYFGSLEFTRDGLDFQKFGKGWGSLLKEVESSPKAHRLLRHSRNYSYAGQGVAVVGAITISEIMTREARGNDVDIGVWIAGGALIVTAIVCDIAHKIKLDRGFMEFNKHISEASDNLEKAGKFNLSFTQSRVCIVYYF